MTKYEELKQYKNGLEEVLNRIRTARNNLRISLGAPDGYGAVHAVFAFQFSGTFNDELRDLVVRYEDHIKAELAKVNDKLAAVETLLAGE